jgi:uncharacterized protein YbjT (DUF2867 family)
MLVTGASGFAGSLLTGRLLNDGHRVRAFGRDPDRVRGALVREGARVADDGRLIDEDRLAGRRPDDRRALEIVRGDALTGDGLERALADVSVAYYLIHSMESPGERSDPGGTFAERERIAAENFAREARRAGVQRIVYLGGLLPAPHPNGAERAPSRHLASRAAVEDVLRAGVADTVALRASIVIGVHSRSFRFLVRLVERLPVLTLPAWRRFRTQPIDSRDVIEMLRTAATAPIAGRTLDVGGPDVLTYGEMLAGIAEQMLVHRPTVGIAVNLTPLAARVAAAIGDEDPELVVPLMEGLEGDLLPREDRAAELLSVDLHSYESAVAHALGEWEKTEPLAAR